MTSTELEVKALWSTEHEATRGDRPPPATSSRSWSSGGGLVRRKRHTHHHKSKIGAGEGVGGGWLNGRVDLPVMPPVEPMLARSVPEIPVAEGMTYEPKWDGFRCLIFRDGDEVELASRGGKTLTRYFPEVVAQRSEERRVGEEGRCQRSAEA